MTARRRAPYAFAALTVIALGLLWRRPELGLPWIAAKYGGSALWGAMVFFIVATLANRASLRTVALVAAVVAAAVEASQLIVYPPLDAFRSTTFGALLLGRTFDWWDIAAYWAGIALVAALTTSARKRLRGSRRAAPPGRSIPSP